MNLNQDKEPSNNMTLNEKRKSLQSLESVGEHIAKKKTDQVLIDIEDMRRAREIANMQV